MVGGILVALAGSLLWLLGSPRLSGILFTCAGLAGAGSGALVGQDSWEKLAQLVAVQLAALAVIAYPRLNAKDPATWLAILVVAVFPLAAEFAGFGGSVPAWLCTVFVPLLQLWWRLEAGEEQARPLLWMLGAFMSSALVAGVLVLVGSPWAAVTYLPFLAVVPLVGWVGVARPDLTDVRGIIARVAVNATAGLGLFAVLMATVSVWSAVAGEYPDPAVLAVIAVMVAFLLEPTRRQLRLITDEFLFGLRPDPLVAAGSLAKGIGNDPVSALDAVRAALALPFARLRVEGAPPAESGVPTEFTEALQLNLDGDAVGELVIGLRAGDLRLPSDDLKVLEVAGPLLAQTARAYALATSLQEARVIAANSREDERFRLRRDLHDGLGPRLSAIAFRAGAAQLKLNDGDQAMAEHLDRLRAESVAAIREIRGLVYGMRPPALDEVGLVDAVRIQAADLRTSDGSPMRVEITTGTMAELPAAVEVAAFRIIMEALTNSARHSGSDWASASLSCTSDALIIEVRDRGRSNGPWRPGVGMASMRERTQELGGTITIAGGVVTVELPRS